jgi:hypothetical protein
MRNEICDFFVCANSNCYVKNCANQPVCANQPLADPGGQLRVSKPQESFPRKV